jgi:hypothetical protein
MLQFIEVCLWMRLWNIHILLASLTGKLLITSWVEDRSVVTLTIQTSSSNTLFIQDKEPRYAFSFSLKSPSKQTHSRLYDRAPTEKSDRLQGFATYISNSSYKFH